MPVEPDTSSELKVVCHNSTINTQPHNSKTPFQIIQNLVEVVHSEKLVTPIVSTVSNKLKLPMHGNRIALMLMEDRL